MKIAYMTFAATAMSVSLLATADAGVVEYSLEADTTAVSVGDTVTITVKASIDPQGGAFSGFATALFDIHAIDPVFGGGVMDSSSPGLGLNPTFAGLGEQGTLASSSILGVSPVQLPQIINPFIDMSTELDLYTFTYTIAEDAPREILLDMVVYMSEVYDGPSSSVPYGSTVSSTTLHVTQVPTPGAIALLCAAGLVGVRRRRK